MVIDAKAYSRGRGMAFRVGVRANDIDDAVQESLIELWQESRKRGAEEFPPSFLWTTLSHWRFHRFNPAQKRRGHICDEPIEEMRSIRDHRPDPCQLLLDAEERHARKELHSAVMTSIYALPDRQRRICTASILEDKSYSEIAERFSITEGAVKRELVLARESMRVTFGATYRPKMAEPFIEVCPRCSGPSKRFGFVNGRPRARCLECGRTFYRKGR